MDSYDIFDYAATIKKAFFSKKQAIAILKLMLISVLRPVLLLAFLFFLNFVYLILISNEHPLILNEQFMTFFGLFYVGFVLLFLVSFFYAFLRLFYDINVFALDSFGYHVEKKPNFFSFAIFKHTLKIPGIFIYSLYTLFYAFLFFFTSLFNFHSRRLLFLGIFLFVLGVIVPQPIDAIFGLLLLFLFAYNSVRFLFAYYYFLTTPSKMIDAFKHSFNATSNGLLKNLLMLVIVFLLCVVSTFVIMLLLRLVLLVITFIAGLFFPSANITSLFFGNPDDSIVYSEFAVSNSSDYFNGSTQSVSTNGLAKSSVAKVANPNMSFIELIVLVILFMIGLMLFLISVYFVFIVSLIYFSAFFVIHYKSKKSNV